MLFTLIDDRDPSVTYTGTWVPGGTTHEKDGTVSSSVKAGDHFSLPFTGTAIAVYGTFDASSAGVKTSYAIDGGSPITVTSSSSGGDSFQQLFWQSPGMPDGSHQLVVTMVSVNKAADGEGTVWFDYFNVTTDAVSPSSSSIPPSATASSPQNSGAAVAKKVSHGALIGGVVAGAVILLLLSAACLLFLRLRKKRNYAATSGDPSSSSMITPWTPTPAMSSTGGPPGSVPVPVPYNPAPRKGQQPHLVYAVGPVPPPDTPYASSGASASSSLTLTLPTHTRLALSTAGSSSSSSAGNNSGSVAEHKRQQQQVVNAYEGIHGGTPVQHVDSGIRQLAPTAAVELPPVYTAI